MCDPCLDAKEGAEHIPGPLGAKYDDAEETIVVSRSAFASILFIFFWLLYRFGLNAFE